MENTTTKFQRNIKKLSRYKVNCVCIDLAFIYPWMKLIWIMVTYIQVIFVFFHTKIQVIKPRCTRCEKKKAKKKKHVYRINFNKRLFPSLNPSFGYNFRIVDISEMGFNHSAVSANLSSSLPCIINSIMAKVSAAATREVENK